MSGPDDIRAFLAHHPDGAMTGRRPGMPGVALTAPEAEFQRRLLAAGHSSSYLALLGLAATLAFDIGGSFFIDEAGLRTADLHNADLRGPESQAGPDDHERGERRGYHRGLQTALACLVMHETGSNPRQAALLVTQHTEMLIRCRWTNRPAEGGR